MAYVKKVLTKRYLVKRDALPGMPEGVTVSTGYLSSNPAVRLRINETDARIQIWGVDDGTEFFEYVIPTDEAERIMGLAFRRTIRMTRTVEYAGRVWRVSEYMGRHSGLVTAVLDLGSKSDGYEVPPWTYRNVSGDKRYTDEGLSSLQVPPPL